MRRAVALLIVLTSSLGLTGCFGGFSKSGDEPASAPPRPSSASGVYAQGCAYLFHDSARWQSISGTWKGKALRWDKRPAGQGRWTAEQERAVQDNAAVGTQGLLAPSERITFQRGCFVAWNRLPRHAWQRTVAGNFKVVRVASWMAQADRLRGRERGSKD